MPDDDISPPLVAVKPGDGGGIKDIKDNDVLSGRGGRINAHRGNIRFRELVSALKHLYLSKTTKKVEKARIAAGIVSEIRKLDPPGRFLKEDGSSGLWIEIGDVKARKKAGQALREDAPDLRNELTVEEEETNMKKEPGTATYGTSPYGLPPGVPMMNVQGQQYQPSFQHPGVSIHAQHPPHMSGFQYPIGPPQASQPEMPLGSNVAQLYKNAQIPTQFQHSLIHTPPQAIWNNTFNYPDPKKPNEQKLDPRAAKEPSQTNFKTEPLMKNSTITVDSDTLEAIASLEEDSRDRKTWSEISTRRVEDPSSLTLPINARTGRSSDMYMDDDALSLLRMSNLSDMDEGENLNFSRMSTMSDTNIFSQESGMMRSHNLSRDAMATTSLTDASFAALIDDTILAPGDDEAGLPTRAELQKFREESLPMSILRRPSSRLVTRELSMMSEISTGMDTLDLDLGSLYPTDGNTKEERG